MKNKPISESEYLDSLDLEKTSDFLRYHNRRCEVMSEVNYSDVKQLCTDYRNIKYDDLPNEVKETVDEIEDNELRLKVVNSFIDERKEVV
jgi:hypothetical protein